MPWRIPFVIGVTSLLAALTGCGGSNQPSPSQPTSASSYAYLATGGPSQSPPYDVRDTGWMRVPKH